jgi:hypothetical protein
MFKLTGVLLVQMIMFGFVVVAGGLAKIAFFVGSRSPQAGEAAGRN